PICRIEGAHPESGIDEDFQMEQQANAEFIAAANPATVLTLLGELEAAEKRIAELEALGRCVKQFSEFQICHYGATEDYAKGYIDCQNNYNKVLFAAAGKGE
ncbi:ead/Ea22-like family protein, partial [Escherichia coli]|uniref:ead/Ea22-like family protein n=1 Tax=Escherichia coli TaxID=562 RepID=UPI003593995A